jgi:hypothetical protein
MQLARKLPVPYLAALTFAIFLLDMLAPDLMPFADELLLALLTLLFGALGPAETPRVVPVPISEPRA